MKLAYYLFSHQWKSFIRNAVWRRNWLSKILLGILVLYFISLFIILGIFIDKILIKAGGDPISTFNSILLWYLPADLLMRCMLQPLPTIDIIPYLRFKIRRSTVINYFLSRSYWNLFNILPWFVFIPFSIKILYPEYGAGFSTLYLIGVLLIISLNNYLAVFIGIISQKKFIYFLIPIVIIATIAWLEKIGYSVRGISTHFGQYLIQGNLLVYGTLAAAIVAVIMYSQRLLFANFYIDEIQSEKNKKTTSSIFGMNLFKKYGDIGNYLSLELNLLMRNKRPRQTLRMLPLLLIYFLFIFNQSGSKGMSSSMPAIMIPILVSLGASMYGQFMFSWESTYFDGIMARKNNLTHYITAKYYLMCSLALITFIPTFIVFSITGKIDLVLLTSYLLFTMGITCFIIMFSGTYNDGRIDLSKSRNFNYQGVKANQFLLTFIFVALPIGIYSLFNYFINDTVGKLAIAIPGFIFILSHNWWIEKIIVPRFNTRKYKNLEGYRKLST